MSKTLKLNKTLEARDVPKENDMRKAIAVMDAQAGQPPYTGDQLRAMLAELGELVPSELAPGVQAVDADKSTLPPVDQRTSAPVQAPPNVHGSFTLNGIPVMASPIKADIDPRTGAPYIQPGPRPSTMISPPPSRRFDGR